MEEVDNRQKKRIKELQGRFFIKKNHFLATTHPLLQSSHPLPKPSFNPLPGIFLQPDVTSHKPKLPPDTSPLSSYIDPSLNTDYANPKSVYNNTTNNVNINLNNYSTISQLISPTCFPVFDNNNSNNNNNININNNKKNIHSSSSVNKSHLSACTNLGNICGKRVREIENEQMLISNPSSLHNTNTNYNNNSNNNNNNNQKNNINCHQIKNIISEIITGSEGNRGEEIDIRPDVLSLMNKQSNRLPLSRSFETPKLFPSQLEIDSLYCENYSPIHTNKLLYNTNTNFDNNNTQNTTIDLNNYIPNSNKLPEYNIRIIYIKLSNGMETKSTELDSTKILQIKRTISERYVGYPISDLSIYYNCNLLSDDISLKDIAKEREITLHLYREISLNYHSKMGEIMRMKMFDNSPLQFLALKLSQSENEDISKVIYNEMEILLNSPVPISSLLRYPQSAIYMELVFPSSPFSMVKGDQSNNNNSNTMNIINIPSGSELCGSSLPFYDFFTDSFQYSTLTSFPSDSIR